MPTALRRRIAPSIPFSLELAEDGGKMLKLELRLAFDFNALALVEEITGKSMLAGEIWQTLTASNVSALFWASLLAHQPEYEGKEGLAMVRSYMDAGNAAAITQAVTRAFVASLPPAQQEAMLNARPTNGASSGPSPVTISDSPRPPLAD
jgi:hypothetical protein